MTVWWCEPLGEAWDLELHNDRPCDKALRMYGVGGVTDDQEHANCGEMQLLPLDARVVVWWCTTHSSQILFGPDDAPGEDGFACFLSWLGEDMKPCWPVKKGLVLALNTEPV